MGRSVGSILLAIARESARQQRLAESARRRALRDAEREQRNAEREEQRSQRALEQTNRELTRLFQVNQREAKAQYQRAQEHEVARLNSTLGQTIENLNGILSHTLSVDDTIVIDTLRIHGSLPMPEMPVALSTRFLPPEKEDYFKSIAAPKGIGALVPGAKKRHEEELDRATAAYEQSVARWQDAERARLEKLTNFELEYSKACEAFERKKQQRNIEVDLLERDYKLGDPDSIVTYCSMVLERSAYPDGFPQNFSIAYAVASRQLVVEYELPTAAVIPTAAEYRYTKSNDTISEKPRKQADVVALYQEIVASVALRTIHEILESDQAGHIDVVCFNGYVHTVDPATGRDIQPHLISVRTTKEQFLQIDLSRVDKKICLKNLGAQVSRQPTEAQPVKPIVEFEMADARFVDQTDLISGLSSATNLMDLNPYEFEQLVANLFGQMGLESKLTRAARDGGVDCVAYDARPVLGGKVVIQAKRYRNSVGVSAVRDLYGTMMNEGANKGILVTTSGYGPDAFDFAKDKPIELIDGGGLLYLLREIGIEARIVFPEQ